MVPVYKKRQFVNHLIIKGILNNDSSQNFFLNLIKGGLMERVVFASNVDLNARYAITINAETKLMIVRINGKFYKGSKMLKYVLRAIKTSNQKLYVYVNTIGNVRLTNQYREAVWNFDLVRELIADSAVELALVEVKKKQYTKLFDDALDKRDFDELAKLRKEYRLEFGI